MKNMFFKKLAILCAALGFAGSAYAQLPMTRTVFNGTYTPLTGATIAAGCVGDDGTTAAVPIGFTFNYLGTNYTTMDLCVNGWASFSSAAANSWTNSNLFQTTTPQFTLAPWWDDLEQLAGSSVQYQTAGTPGSQTFTVEWTNIASYRVSTTGRNLNFQVILYEGTNVIEFRYQQTALSGYANTNESASIGIEGATGGAGNFIDAVSGSSFVSNSAMTTDKWPTMYYRFTPGAPTALAGGTYTVGSTGAYPNITEAVADINHRGITGPVTLSLVDALYDTSSAGGRNIFPVIFGPVAGNSAVNTISMQPASGSATLRYRGVVSGNVGNQANAIVFTATTEAIVYVLGTDYVSMNNLNLQTTGNGLVDRGLYVANATSTDGSQNGLYQNISVTLMRTNTSTIGIQQNVITTPTNVTGANSGNIYRNLTISNTYGGMYLLGNATYPDLNCQIGNTSPTAFNTIGSATTYDIGGGTTATQTYGIRAASQSGVKIYNNVVQNVSATTTSDGILVELGQGVCEVYNNNVRFVRNNGTASTAVAAGIRANLATTGSHSMRVYNNFVSNISSGYTGAATTTRIVRGINVQSAGGGVNTLTINVDANNVSIDASGSPNASSTCFEIGTTSGPVMNVRNNVFFNATGAQTAPAYHNCWNSTSATLVGNTGSVSNYNDLYVSNTTQGFVGRGNTTDYATLANWQAGMVGQDANSVSIDPGYLSSTDLHVSAAGLNNVGNLAAAAWVTVDFDNQVRSGTPDIGADEFAPASIDMGALLLVTPVAGGCYSSTENVTIRIRNNAATTIDFSVTPVTITTNVTGAITATLTYTVNTGTLASATNADYVVGTVNMSGAGSYVFNAYTTVSGDGQPLNDAMPAATINYQPGTATAMPASVCAGATSTLTLSGNTNTGIQWQQSTDGGVTWNNIPGATTSPYVATPTDTTVYRSVMCGTLNSTTTTVIYNPTTPPTVTADTVCGQDTVTLVASGNGTLNWYTVPTGGVPVYTGATYSPVISTTTTYYVESSSGAGSQNIGAPSNAIGTGLLSTAPQWLNFDVMQSCVLQSVVVYPGAAGNVVLEWQTSAGGVIQSATMAVSAAQINTPVVMTLNWNLTPGTGYRLARGAASVSLYRNDAGAVYPYTFPGVVSITGNSFSATYYYWGYNWTILSGCQSTRTPVTAVVNTSASVVASAASATICETDSTTLTATSTNMGYIYTWTPAATLSSPTGATVTATPSASTTYIVRADSADCSVFDTISIAVNALPTGSIMVTDTLICIGQSDTLIANYTTGGLITEGTDVNVPDATPAGATSTIAVPYSHIIGPASNMMVRFNMTHTWDSDMSFTLISPQGTMLDLCSGNGGSGDNFVNTVFNTTSATNITAGVAPFTGQWQPEGAGGLGVFNGEQAQGTWTLLMVDGAAGDLGTLLDWSIYFEASNTISWTSNPVGFTSTLDSITVNPAVTTDYILTITDTVTGCARVYTQTVMVNAPLTVSVSADTTICNGDTIMVTANGAGGDGNISYSWSNGDTTATTMVTPSALTDYAVTISDGCSTPVAMDTVTVDIGTPIAISTISNDTTVCAAAPVVLWVTTSGGLGATMYNWSNGPMTALDSVTAGGVGTSTTFGVMVMDGCGTMAMDTVTVMAFGAPSAMVMNADTTLCMGDSLVLMSMGSGGDGNISYSWNNGPVTALDSITAMSNMTYVVTVMDGCGTTAMDSVVVNAFTMPTVTASNDTAVCYPSFAYLSSTANGGDGNYMYMWTSGGTQATDSVALFGTMMQYVTVTDGCGNSNMDSVLVTVNMAPVAGFSSSGTGATFNFTDASTNATSWSWNFGDSNTSTSQSPSHTYASNGTYTVTLIVTNSCGSDTTTQVVVIDVGINDPAALSGVVVYPNPSSDVFNVNFGMAIAGHVNIAMFDAQGKLVYSQQMENVAAGTIVPVDIAAYESGIYFLQVTGDNNGRTYKVNVQH